MDTFIALAREDLAVARKVVDEFPRDAAFPRLGGGMPRTPLKNVLKAGVADVSSLVREIQDWRNEKFSDSPHLKR